jgi:hypothetical protein
MGLRGIVRIVFNISFKEVIQHLLRHGKLLDLDPNRLFTSLMAMAKKALLNS